MSSIQNIRYAEKSLRNGETTNLNFVSKIKEKNLLLLFPLRWKLDSSKCQHQINMNWEVFTSGQWWHWENWQKCDRGDYWLCQSMDLAKLHQLEQIIALTPFLLVLNEQASLEEFFFLQFFVFGTPLLGLSNERPLNRSENTAREHWIFEKYMSLTENYESVTFVGTALKIFCFLQCFCCDIYLVVNHIA